MSDNDKLADALQALAGAIGDLKVETTKNGIALAALVQGRPAEPVTRPDIPVEPNDGNAAVIYTDEDLSQDPDPEAFEIDPKTNRKVPLPGYYGVSCRGYPFDEHGQECYRGTLDKMKHAKAPPPGSIDCHSCGTRGGLRRIQKSVKGKPVSLLACVKCKTEIPV
jgi:hypothetical protein